MSVMHYDTPQVTQEHDFMFDLRGYLLLEQAISPERWSRASTPPSTRCRPSSRSSGTATCTATT